MYNQYFGLKENPFALSPDPRYLYLSRRHQEALAHLMYGITGGGGFVLLTGEVGTGKTLMIRALLQRLPDSVDVALVLYPFLSVREFMVALCDDLRVPRPPEPSLKTLIDTLNGFLLENHARGRRTVLIVDEAHRLNREVLEQIRLLTNLETTKEKLLQIVLVGQPELNSVLSQPDMRQLTQRITARFDLRALTAHDTRAYVRHRCRVAGGATPLFSAPALWWVQRATHGIPRLINILCDRALLAAYARGRHRVGSRLIHAAAREVETGASPKRFRAALALGAAIVMLVSGFAVWRFAPQWRPFAVSGAPVVTAPQADPGAVSDSLPAAAPGDHSAVPVAPAPVSLAQLLADPAVPTNTDTAFAQLFARWGMDYTQATGGTGCERAQQVGLRCLFESGTWNNLRQLNRPAIVELVEESGTRHHVLVSRLSEDRVTFAFPDREYEFAFSEVDRVWFGKYLLLWSPPQAGERPVWRGMRGAPVVWVRDALAQYGLPRSSRPGSDVFDGELEGQVREFQRRHQLQDDGIVGRMTLIYLRTYDSNAQSPQLTAMRDVTAGP
jgi:general secretion pathway protein A